MDSKSLAIDHKKRYRSKIDNKRRGKQVAERCWLLLEVSKS